MRLLRAWVTMAGHDSLCLFSAPELFLCSSQCDVGQSKLLESDNGRRNFQDGNSICQEAKWQASHDGWAMGSSPRPLSSPCFGVLDMGHLESVRSASRHI